MYNHLGNEISYSKLSLLDQSVVKYYNRYVLKLPEPIKTSYRFGTAFDAYMTDNEAFSRYIIKDTATTTVENCITRIEYNNIVKMGESVAKFNNWSNHTKMFNNYSLSEIFDIADKQSELYWNDGVACRGKLDYDLLLPNDRIILDLKSTAAESLEDCIKSIFNFRYYLQAAHYINAIKTLTPDLRPHFYFVFVSKTTHECWVLHVTDELLVYGNAARARLINKLQLLESTKDWLKPEPCADILVPAWLKNKL